MLYNIGFTEAVKHGNWSCFIFHDVDLLPENDMNMYNCSNFPNSIKHMSVAVDKFEYELPYSWLVGGVVAFTKEQFKLVNGYSNQFWGWGGEDDDLYKRVEAKDLSIVRDTPEIAR